MRRPTPARRGARTSPNAAGAATRERLLRAAERLVARNGIDGVSTREILLAAKADSAAIHYHFGSKNELMAAVFHRRINDLVEGVDRFLAHRMANGRALTARDLAEAVVLPVAAVARDRRSGGCHYMGFLAALLNYRPLAKLRSSDTLWTDRLLGAYEQLSPQLTPADRRRRVGFAAYLAIGAFSEGAVHDWFAQTLPEPVRELEDDLIDFLAVGLTPSRQSQGFLERIQSTA
jgi:AcrR family transcriptional regulator